MRGRRVSAAATEDGCETKSGSAPRTGHAPAPVQLYISIAALGYFYLSNNHTLSTIFARDQMRVQALKQRLAHMTKLVLGYLMK
jgi:Tetracyclin repressor-like, C-terminal domain